MKRFRIVDAGLREGRFNIALDQAMLELHQAGEIPDSIRFIHFWPTALIGRHQELSREVDLDYCRKQGIAVGRRITGGGAIYLDPGQLGWELVFHRRSLGAATLGEVARQICEAAAFGLSQLGVKASFRPRNDIEVNGRKISGTGGFFDGDTLIYQGTVLIDLDPQTMLRALRIPRAKMAKRGLDSAAQRVVTLRELLCGVAPPVRQVEQALLAGFAARLGLTFERAALTSSEEQLAQHLYDSQIGRDEFVAEIDRPAEAGQVRVGEHTSAGGTITSYVRCEGVRDARIAQVLITGDFFVAPARLVLDLEGALKGTEVVSLRQTIESFFTTHAMGTLSVNAEDFCRSIEAAFTSDASTAVGMRTSSIS